MTPATLVYTRAELGVDAPVVQIELHVSGGLPRFTVVGLPDSAGREAKERVRAALENCQFSLPRKAFLVNLAPADLSKEGGRFDLPIAIGLLATCGLLSDDAREQLSKYEFIGELGLYGELRPVRGVLPAAMAVFHTGRTLIVPTENLAEASLAAGGKVLGAKRLTDVVAHLASNGNLDASLQAPRRLIASYPDLADVRGQESARRALEVAAAGGHNLIFVGPPGTGKTMLATRLPGLLPELDVDAASEVANVYSVSHGRFDVSTWRQRPFRAPHHSASYAAMVGGGPHPRPGELSLAHHGVLFLDEMPEFSRRVLEVLREPLESRLVSISRASYKVDLPAEILLVAAMNPCHCGYLGDGTDRCECTPGQIARYRNRVSGPLLDRIDLHVEVPQQSITALRRASPGESSAVVRERVLLARERQLIRAGVLNARLDVQTLENDCRLGDDQADLLETASDRLGLSARACNRVLKVARTIADLEGSPKIDAPHLLEAIGYRVLDRVP